MSELQKQLLYFYFALKLSEIASMIHYVEMLELGRFFIKKYFK